MTNKNRITIAVTDAGPPYQRISGDVGTYRLLCKQVNDLVKFKRIAIARIQDMLKGDDGQAWKEARKFLEHNGVTPND